jgi:MFS family permease
VSAPSHLRRNFAAFMTDFVLVSVAIAFIDPNTIMASLFDQLTGSTLFIGLASTLWPLGILAPQLLFAPFFATRRRKKPFMVWPLLVGPIVFGAVATVLWRSEASNPWLLAWISLAGMTIFAVANGFLFVPWLDVLSRAVPPRPRGWLFGLQQGLTATVGLGVGTAVHFILTTEGLEFPKNYATLFAAAAALIGAGTVAMALVKEPTHEVELAKDARGALPDIREVVRSDRRLRRFVLVRVTLDSARIADPFYVVYAINSLHVAPSEVGTFLACRLLGTAIGGPVMGLVSSRLGSAMVIRLAGGAAVLQSALVLLTLFWSGVAFIYAAFALAGVVQAALFPGYMGYVMELAPERSRPLYLGISNTIGSIGSFSPLVGGALLTWLTMPQLVPIALTIAAVATVGALSLEEPRLRSRLAFTAASGGP